MKRILGSLLVATLPSGSVLADGSLFRRIKRSGVAMSTLRILGTALVPRHSGYDSLAEGDLAPIGLG